LAVLNENKGLGDILKNPLLSRVQKDNVVRELATNRKANELTANTLAVLGDNGRLGRLRKVITQFLTLMSAHKGEVKTTVTTAKPMDAAQLKELQSVLQAFIAPGHKLQLETRVNPNLIGGMIVELADRYVDLSISSKLRVYSEIVKDTL